MRCSGKIYWDRNRRLPPRFPMSHLLPSPCGRSPILSSSSPEEKPESTNCTIGSVRFSLCPRWNSVAFVPSCALARALFLSLLGVVCLGPAWLLWRENVKTSRGTEWRDGYYWEEEELAFVRLIILSLVWEGPRPCFKLTSQFPSPLKACAGVFPLPNHFLDHQGFCIPYPIRSFSQAKYLPFMVVPIEHASKQKDVPSHPAEDFHCCFILTSQ